jgi:HEAT repeat protein
MTLGRIGPPARDGLPTLKERARSDPAPEVRRAAISAIASVGDGDSESISALVAILESADDDGRLAAARTLGGDPKCKVAEAIPALARRLKDPSAKVREQAAESLGAMAPVSAPAVPALTEALRDSQAEVRAEAAEALERLAAYARPAVPELMAALNDPDPKVRSEVAGTLERIVRDWGEGEPALRQQVVDALGRAGRGPLP